MKNKVLSALAVRCACDLGHTAGDQQSVIAIVRRSPAREQVRPAPVSWFDCHLIDATMASNRRRWNPIFTFRSCKPPAWLVALGDTPHWKARNLRLRIGHRDAGKTRTQMAHSRGVAVSLSAHTGITETVSLAVW
ncbi:hypothetical protein A0H81_12890 [Grifola frondosa]|uniref:Uncharacterized protein n=1 Tax=Grifola frondosa TaxID=5627 RepID=A0A1C7LRS2_GRIFR|nr:hypothetical protein A0H81_12890 [Grifola frondosa]